MGKNTQLHEYLFSVLGLEEAPWGCILDKWSFVDFDMYNGLELENIHVTGHVREVAYNFDLLLFLKLHSYININYNATDLT